MHHLSRLAAAACALSLFGAAALAASPCDRLAEHAKALPPGAWGGGSKALQPWLQIDSAASEPTGFEAVLAKDPLVLKATDNEDGNWTVSVERLARTDIYAASTYQGTLHCQSIAFLHASPGKPIREIAGPTSAKDEDELCWTRGGDFGRVLGQPAYVEHGANDQTTSDEDIRISTWGDNRWSPACLVKLRYIPSFKVVERRCRDAKACATLDKKILAIAEAYHRKRQAPKDETPFVYPSGATSGAVRQAASAKREATVSPSWPGFGDEPEQRPVSYSGLAYFPLKLDGQDYVAAIGHEGVGWRENSNTLLLLFSLENGALVPRAAYAVDRGVGGLKSVSTE